MNTGNLVGLYGGLFLVQLPIIIVATIGLIMAARARERLGEAFLFSAWGFGTIIVSRLASVILDGLARSSPVTGAAAAETAQGQGEALALGVRLSAAGFVSGGLFLIGLILLTLSIFRGRSDGSSSIAA